VKTTRIINARRAAIALLVALTLGATTVGCSSSADEPREITVFAAASLRASFEELGQSFETNEGVKVNFNFGNSHALAVGIAEGNAGDVFASADLAAMDDANITDFEQFATNELTVAVRTDTTDAPTTREELESVGIAQCVETAPCGILAREFATTNNLDLDIRTEGSDVSNTFAALLTDQVDAALVYSTDATGNVDTVIADIPDLTFPATTYGIAPTSDVATAQEFVDFVLSAEGQAVLANYGFGEAPQ
jgi:molybdate transport system substrate-binding protein